jgi:hypothetical protein
MKTLPFVWALALCCAHAQSGQNSLVERFDSTTPPLLPAGWSTSTNRSPSGDFVATTSSPRSSPNTLLSTNATISQSLTSPSLNFTALTPARLEFYTSRSSSHTAGLLVEASTDNGSTYSLSLKDTLRNSGATGYALTSLPLPSLLANQSSVRFRWRLIGSSTGGTSGTFRLDDVTVTSTPAFDLELTRLQVNSSEPLSSIAPGQRIVLKAIVTNRGSQNAAEYAVHFFLDANFNGRAESAEEFIAINADALCAPDSAQVLASSPPLIAGDNRFLAVVSWISDTNPRNDTASVDILTGAASQTLVVNEIMFEPSAGQNDWVELYHRGEENADISQWRLSDRPTSSATNSFVITGIPTLVHPHDYVLIAADSSLFTQFPYLAAPGPTVHVLILNRSGGLGLNNEGDDVVLRDALGHTIDSVAYFSSWHHPDVTLTKGRSLERVNPGLSSNDRRNWSTSPSSLGGTPGRPNGIFTTRLPSDASLDVSPNPFSPDGDGIEDFCIMHYSLPLTTSVIRISIFDVRGRLIRRLAHAELSGPQGDVVWDGLDDTQQRVRIGPYIVFVEAIDGEAGVLATAKTVVVVATPL